MQSTRQRRQRQRQRRRMVCFGKCITKIGIQRIPIKRKGQWGREREKKASNERPRKKTRTENKSYSIIVKYCDTFSMCALRCVAVCIRTKTLLLAALMWKRRMNTLWKNGRLCCCFCCSFCLCNLLVVGQKPSRTEINSLLPALCFFLFSIFGWMFFKWSLSLN